MFPQTTESMMIIGLDTAKMLKKLEYPIVSEFSYIVYDYGVTIIENKEAINLIDEADNNSISVRTLRDDQSIPRIAIALYYKLIDSKSEIAKNIYPAPSQPVLQQWLRNYMGLHINISVQEEGWTYRLQSSKGRSKGRGEHISNFYTTYDLALEIGLKDAIMTILIAMGKERGCV